jgi:1-acyl-sn-glycerol-3-phosphate acyltransferase/ribosomal protein S27AE
MKNENKSFNEIKVRRPAFFLYSVGAFLLRIFTKFKLHHSIDRSGLKGVKAPMLAIANHCSTMDAVFSVQSLLPHRFNIVTSKDLFTWPVLKPFIKSFGAIPKSQCTIDITSLKTIKKALEQKRNVIIYPEGRTSLDGTQLMYLAPNVAKFVKLMDATVVLVKTEGGYLTKPRWFKGFRKGKVHTTTSILLTQEQVRSLSVKEIYNIVTENLTFNDNIWQQENHVRFRSKHLAKGLEYILYKCPKCGAEYEMYTDDKHLICGHCGNTVEYTEYGELKPIGDSVSKNRVDLWYNYCRESVLEEVKKDDFRMCHQAELNVVDPNTKKFVTVGAGELSIDKEYLWFNGSKDGKPFEIKQPLRLLPTLLTKNDEGLDIIENDETYRCLFTEHKYSSKYGLAAEMLFAYNNGLLEKSKLK